jgi:rRNA processing protein Gar1
MCATLNTGEVTSIVGDQVVVKSTAKQFGIGTVVYNDRGKIGVVSDIIGAVDNPYFVVKPQGNVKATVGDRTHLG